MTKIEGAVVNAVGQLTGAVSSRSLTGLVASGGMIVNDWQITMEEIEGGHRLTARRGTEVQTMDIMDGEPGEDGYTPVKGVDYFDGKDGEPGKDGYTPIKGVDYFDGESGVYVGSEEPDDPNIQVWIDPNGKADEPNSPGTSVQPDWNQNDETQPDYVKNRTHYEIPPKFDIRWNGDMTGRFAMPLDDLGAPGLYLVKVSDVVLTPEEMVGGVFSYSDGTLKEIDGENVSIESTLPGTYGPSNNITVVYDQLTLNAVLGLPDGYITEGVYFMCFPADDFYVASFIGKSSVAKIDEKYLPDNVATKEFVASLIGDAIGGSY